MDDGTTEYETYKVEDAMALRALAHPTRMALIEAVGVHGTLTATQASEIVGESPTNCAFHLRTLAKHGFVVEAEGGRGRERPWRLGHTGFSFSPDQDDTAAAVAGAALVRLTRERWFERVRRYSENRPHYPPEVREVSGATETVFFVTLDEMRQIEREMRALMVRYADRIDPEKRPPDSITFEGLFFLHPFDAPPSHEGD